MTIFMLRPLFIGCCHNKKAAGILIITNKSDNLFINITRCKLQLCVLIKKNLLQNKLQLVEPIDFENFVLKNKTLLQNDSQRELFLYPPDDISVSNCKFKKKIPVDVTLHFFQQIVLPRRFRTVNQTVPNRSDTEDCNLFTKQCIANYSSNWNLIHYKYSAYSGSYADLPKIPCNDNLKEEVFEIDIDGDSAEDFPLQVDGITKEGYLMKGPEIGT